jgi:hypothetical protein
VAHPFRVPAAGLISCPRGLRTEAIDVLGADVIEIDSELSKLEESLGGS